MEQHDARNLIGTLPQAAGGGFPDEPPREVNRSPRYPTPPPFNRGGGPDRLAGSAGAVAEPRRCAASSSRQALAAGLARDEPGPADDGRREHVED